MDASAMSRDRENRLESRVSAATTERAGWASFRGVRVAVRGSGVAGTMRITADAALLDGFGPVPADSTYGYSRFPMAEADVPEGELSNVVLSETRTTAIDGLVAGDAGLFGRIANRWLPLTNETGFVQDGVPMLRVQAPDDAPDGFDWQRRAGRRIADVPRSAVEAIEHREVIGVWRGADVRVVRADPEGALILSSGGDGAEEIVGIDPTDAARAGWSAHVALDEVRASVRVDRRRPLAPAFFASPIAEVDGLVESISRLEMEPGALAPNGERESLAATERGIPGTRMAWYPFSASRPAAPGEWRRLLGASDVLKIVRVDTEALIDGRWTPIALRDETTWSVYTAGGTEVLIDRVDGFRYRTEEIDPAVLPAVTFRRGYLEAIGVC